MFLAVVITLNAIAIVLSNGSKIAIKGGREFYVYIICVDCVFLYCQKRK